MQLDISKIRSKPGSEINVELEEDIGSISGRQVTFLKPVRLHGKMRNIDGDLYFQGDAVVVMELICDRCLKPYQETLDLVLDEIFYPEFKKVDDIDFYKTYNGNQLEMDQMIHDGVLLKISMNSICQEDCLGLCAHCGADLNEGPCSCEVDEVDPRMEILKNLISEE